MQVELALEPEAAAIYVIREQRMDQDSFHKYEAERKILLADLGGKKSQNQIYTSDYRC